MQGGGDRRDGQREFTPLMHLRSTWHPLGRPAIATTHQLLVILSLILPSPVRVQRVYAGNPCSLAPEHFQELERENMQEGAYTSLFHFTRSWSCFFREQNPVGTPLRTPAST